MVLARKKGPAPLRGPGLWETLAEILPGRRRPFDCVQVEVSSRCAGRCCYCPRHVWRRDWQPREMTMETFRRLWPLMRRAARVHLQGWGEPLDHPAFFEMASLARRAGCQVSTTTCGLAVDPAMATRLVQSGLDIVAFSLAGIDAPSNQARQGIDFERVCAAVSTLQAERRRRQAVHLEIHLAYLMLASSMEAVARLPRLMERLGVHGAVVSTLDYLPDPSLTAETFGAHDIQGCRCGAELLAGAAAEARARGLDLHYRFSPLEPAGPGCSENIQRSLFVSAAGAVSPCVYTDIPSPRADHRRRVFGHLDTTDPLAIWQDPAYRRFRQALAAGAPDPVCRSCPKRGLAPSGPGAARTVSGLDSDLSAG